MENCAIEMLPEIGSDGQPVYCAAEPASLRDAKFGPQDLVEPPALAPPCRGLLAFVLLVGAFLFAVSCKK